jgi:hypothetical protein
MASTTTQVLELLLAFGLSALVGVMFTLSGAGVHHATNVIAGMDGVRGIDRVDEEAE